MYKIFQLKKKKPNPQQIGVVAQSSGTCWECNLDFSSDCYVEESDSLCLQLSLNWKFSFKYDEFLIILCT